MKTKLANDHYDNLSVVNVSDFGSEFTHDCESQMSDVLSVQSKTSLPTSLSKSSCVSPYKTSNISDFSDLANMIALNDLSKDNQQRLKVTKPSDIKPSEPQTSTFKIRQL